MLWQNFQTAKDFITNIDDSKVKGVHILFCSCSQSSYITEKAVKTLILEPLWWKKYNNKNVSQEKYW